MDPNKIDLNNLSKNFEYYKIASEIDSIECLDALRNIAKSYVKLYLRQQEVILSFSESLGVNEV